jgi:hypothetical protein
MGFNLGKAIKKTVKKATKNIKHPEKIIKKSAGRSLDMMKGTFDNLKKEGKGIGQGIKDIKNGHTNRGLKGVFGNTANLAFDSVKAPGAFVSGAAVGATLGATDGLIGTNISKTVSDLNKSPSMINRIITSDVSAAVDLPTQLRKKDIQGATFGAMQVGGDLSATGLAFHAGFDTLATVQSKLTPVKKPLPPPPQPKVTVAMVDEKTSDSAIAESETVGDWSMDNDTVKIALYISAFALFAMLIWSMVRRK